MVYVRSCSDNLLLGMIRSGHEAGMLSYNGAQTLLFQLPAAHHTHRQRWYNRVCRSEVGVHKTKAARKSASLANQAT